MPGKEAWLHIPDMLVFSHIYIYISVETVGCHVECVWLHAHAQFQHGDVGTGQVLLRTVNELLLEACFKLQGFKFPRQSF